MAFDFAELAFQTRLIFSTEEEARLTSFGNMSIQVRRAAETLGYDPANLNHEQETDIILSLKDPQRSIFIAAAHLAELRDQDFPGTGMEMTLDEIRVTASRFNIGPDPTLDEIQADTNYGDVIVDDVGIDTLKELLQ